MVLWQLLAICGMAFLILEMFTPSMFFLNFSLASFICAVLSFYTKNPYVLVIAFFVFSFVSFIFLRPIIMKKVKHIILLFMNLNMLTMMKLVKQKVLMQNGTIQHLLNSQKKVL